MVRRPGARPPPHPELLAAFALAASGCSLITDSFEINQFSGDPYPIDVDLQTGAIIVGVREIGNEAPDRVAVIDVLSPLTVEDPGPDVAPSISTADLSVLGRDLTMPDGPLLRPRARLSGAQLLSLHPCSHLDVDCQVGTPALALPYQVLIGADALAGDAVRLRLGEQQLFILPDIAGPATDRTEMCDAVFPSPYRGGGTLVIGGTEVGFGGRRIALQSCLGADPGRALQSERGTDALLVVSTSIGTSLLAASAYERYRILNPAAPPIEALPSEIVLLPSGPISGGRATISNIALVAASSSTPRAPCRQVYAQRFLSASLARCKEPGEAGEELEDCPCDDNETSCGVPAVVELTPPTGVSLLVVDDANPTLQALRTELRPDQAELDGILGTDALRTSEIDIDYPHDRLLMRCTSVDCVARRELTPETDFATCL